MGKKTIKGGRSRSRYTIGYRKPPRSTRFRPGHSGNPAGRPRGARNASSLAKVALERRITVDHNGRRRRMTVREIACLRLADKAMSGDLRALDYLLMLADERQPTTGEGADSTPSTELDVATIEQFVARWQRRRGNAP